MRTWSPETIALILGGITAIIGALATAAVRVITALQGVEKKVDQLEIKVDGRLSQLLERTAQSSRAEGVVAGRGEMVTVPVPPAVTTVDATHLQEDGTLVIGVPNNPTPPVLLVPVEEAPLTEGSQEGAKP